MIQNKVPWSDETKIEPFLIGGIVRPTEHLGRESPSQKKNTEDGLLMDLLE